MAKRRKSTFERLNTGQMNRAQRRELGRRVVASDVSEFGPASGADGIIGPAKKTQPSAACSVDAA